MDLAVDTIMAVARTNQSEGCGRGRGHEGTGTDFRLALERSVLEYA